MNRAPTKEIIRILELSVKHWTDAEAACDEIIPILADDREIEKWRSRAMNYRAQAEIQRALIAVMREDSETLETIAE